jgi:hypothetical protein
MAGKGTMPPLVQVILETLCNGMQPK